MESDSLNPSKNPDSGNVVVNFNYVQKESSDFSSMVKEVLKIDMLEAAPNSIYT